MHLVQLLIPVVDSAGNAYPRDYFLQVRSELLDKFGGVTAFTQAPATGLWTAPSGDTVRDDVVVYEVMIPGLDRQWWSNYRRDLEKRFNQQELVIRAHLIDRL